MKVGTYQIGRYHGIIKKLYEDGSVDYETSFTSQDDLMRSVYAMRRCWGQMVGLATDNSRVLTDIKIIRGKEAIIRSLMAKIKILEKYR